MALPRPSLVAELCHHRQRYLAVTPCGLGAQPACAGLLKPLAPDQAFALLGSLPVRQRDEAVIHTVAPADYATRQVPFIGKVEYPDVIDLGIPSYRLAEADREALKFSKDEPKGVCGSALATPLGDALIELVGTYLRRMPNELALKQLARVEREGPGNLWFCWAGGARRGTPHYYRVQGSHLLIEFDNAIDEGNTSTPCGATTVTSSATTCWPATTSGSAPPDIT
jgi:hypothetical protein